MASHVEKDPLDEEIAENPKKEDEGFKGNIANRISQKYSRPEKKFAFKLHR